MKKISFLFIAASLLLLLNPISSIAEDIIRKTVLVSFTDCADFEGSVGSPITSVEQLIYYVGDEEVARFCIDLHFNITKKRGAVPDGTATEYFENGQVKFREDFKDNMRQGEAIEYFEDGKTKQSLNFLDDKLEGVRTTFYPTGRLSAEIMYKSGQQNGIAKRYFPEGGLAQESTYKDGKMEGPLKTYYQNGQLQRQATVKDLHDVGISKHYYENGQLQAEFDNDQKSISKVYYEDGSIHGIINYNENGKVVGREYDRHGNLVNEEVMDRPPSE
ncbi:MAG: toxin-antitoxin system YwqK family antitoxin [Candidatus Omnitrophica bacterium]|nr:toxin-antitoxin system YwqK family antitoxin [Candidatus Omnitrophota bacterium]